MGGQRGRDVLIAIGDGGEPELFFAVAGIRARTIALSSRLVDATTAQSPQAWRELIAGAATKRIEVAGSGMFWVAWRWARRRSTRPSSRAMIGSFTPIGPAPCARRDLCRGGGAG